jgi:hypothetical protein
VGITRGGLGVGVKIGWSGERVTGINGVEMGIGVPGSMGVFNTNWYGSWFFVLRVQPTRKITNTITPQKTRLIIFHS